MKKHVVMGITGGIAAYKSCEVVSNLGKHGIEVDVIMTQNATQLVQPLTFETLSKRPVTLNTFERITQFDVRHISLAQKADVFLVAPATANIIAKLAHGIADDMLSTTLLATKAPILLAPAMNTQMWQAEATQNNIEILKKRGVYFVGPEDGVLACGDIGKGRMSEPSDIVAKTIELCNPKLDLAGLSVLVTAGSSIERIDPVRYLTNDSSGKMGMAIAKCAKERGAEVTLMLGKVSVTPPSGVKIIPFDTTLNLHKKMCDISKQYDIIIQAAAPADYRVENIATQKIKKQSGESITLTLVENPDVAKAVGKQKQLGQILVGFAAETQNIKSHAQEKRKKKNLDLIVANDITKEGAGFGSDTNIVTLYSEIGEKELPILPKLEVAHAIFDEVMLIKNKV